jgi:hypothetical protein
MIDCPHCGKPLAEDDFPAVPASKSVAPGGKSPGGPWADVARVTNLAEVGYLAEVLENHGVAVQLERRDEFTGQNGNVFPWYVVRVPASEASRAAELLQQEVERTGADPTEDVEDLAAPRVPLAPLLATGSSVWISILAVLVVGGIAYGAGRGWFEFAGDGSRSLWETLVETPGTLEYRSPPGAARREVRFEGDANRAVIDDDLDGDGRFDRRRVFENGYLVEDKHH